jgi:parallel beta-helix repeat protein
MRTFALLAALFIATGCPNNNSGSDAGTDGGNAGMDAATPGPDAGADAGSAACAAVCGPCVAFAANATETTIASAIETAANGTTLVFAAGTFHFTNALTLDSQNNITIIGAGIAATILDFSGAATGAGPDGIDATNMNGLTLYNFTVQNTKANAIKVSQSQNVTIESVKTSLGPAGMTSNGPYGIYPVNVTNILIENSVAMGASDTGIYVGQAINAVIRNNETFGNVAGIEIENTFYADVYNNYSHDNTAGILVFDLPTLPQQGTHDVHVHNNQMVNNNQPNFATNGDIVSQVPAGTGSFVMASHDVEIDHNVLTNDQSVGLAVISFFAALTPITDPNYYPYSHDVFVHDNTLSNIGGSPDTNVQFGQLLNFSLFSFPGDHVPDVAYDGVIDFGWAADAGTLRLADGGANPDPMNISFENNVEVTSSDAGLANDGGPADFVDLNFCQLVVQEGPSPGPVSCVDTALLDGGLEPPDGSFVAPDSGACNGEVTNLSCIDNFVITPFTSQGFAAPGVDAGLVFIDGGICE